MARTISDCSPFRRNSKLETFLKRNTERDVYERIRAYEPCVVISGTINKVFMHVVLSDDCIYLTEYPPRTLQQVLHFRDILDIALINDLPDFLSGRAREQSLHIRIVYTRAKATGRGELGTSSECSSGPAPAHSVPRPCVAAPPGGDERRLRAALKRDDGDGGESVRPRRPASCPTHPDKRDRGLPQHSRQALSSTPCPRLLRVTQTLPLGPAIGCRSFSLARLMKRTVREREEGGEGQEVELHLYSVSLTSRIHLLLQSSWNSYIMRSTLMLDPVYKRKCNVSLSPFPKKQSESNPRALGWEQTSQLFGQLSAEILQEHLNMETLYLLLQELGTATHRNPAVRKLFWRSPELFPFLVHTLEDNSEDRSLTIDTLLLCTLVVQTLSLMFRETESDPACLRMLSSNQGSMMASMLLAVLTAPEVLLPRAPPLHNHHITSQKQALEAEYLDAASALVFEVLVFCQESSHAPAPGHFLTVGWVFTTLQSHPSLVGFVGYQAQQVVLALAPSGCPLSPAQAVLLYQRCRVLLACMQNSATLSTYVTTEFKEEFRYYVGLSGLEDRLHPEYPISKQTQTLFTELLLRVIPRLTTRTVSALQNGS